MNSTTQALARTVMLMVILLLTSVSASRADEIRTALLVLDEVAQNQFSVQWKRPLQQGRVLPLEIEFPSHCATLKERDKTQRIQTRALTQFWFVRCEGDGLAGYPLRILGLSNLATDVMIRVTLRDGNSHQRILRGNRDSFEIPEVVDAGRVAIDYLVFGVEHILSGLDHLLFVLVLLFLCGSAWVTAKTITGFTLAHSITLVAASMQWLTVPQQPVEILIALSIVFLAVEIIRKWRGQLGLAARKPWLVSFIFGLLHGLGFAGALAEMGLPQQNVPLALAMFNVGVELGQLAFVSAVIGAQLLLARIVLQRFDKRLLILDRIVVWGLGIVASFWFWQRLAGI